MNFYEYNECFIWTIQLPKLVILFTFHLFWQKPFVRGSNQKYYYKMDVQTLQYAFLIRIYIF